MTSSVIIAVIVVLLGVILLYPITLSDGRVVEIDWVLYYEVMDAKAAVYEVSDFLMALEQLGVTALRAVGGDMDLEQILAARDEINGKLREVLSEAANNWGIRVHRVELAGQPHLV